MMDIGFVRAQIEKVDLTMEERVDFNKVYKNLTGLQQKILQLYLAGYTPKEITKILERNITQVQHSLFRIAVRFHRAFRDRSKGRWKELEYQFWQ